MSPTSEGGEKKPKKTKTLVSFNKLNCRNKDKIGLQKISEEISRAVLCVDLTQGEIL